MAHFCGEEDKDGKGYVLISANADRLEVTYRNVAGLAYEDHFTIE